MKTTKIIILVVSAIAVIIATAIWRCENMAIMASSPEVVKSTIEQSNNLNSTVYEIKEYDDRIEWIRHKDGEAITYIHMYFIENNIVYAEYIKCIFKNQYEAKYRINNFMEIAGEVKLDGNILEGKVKKQDLVGFSKEDAIERIKINSEQYIKIEQP